MEDFRKISEESNRFQLTYVHCYSAYNRVILTKLKGKFVHTMGYPSSVRLPGDNDTTNAKTKSTVLYPEEALFLLENV